MRFQEELVIVSLLTLRYFDVKIIKKEEFQTLMLKHRETDLCLQANESGLQLSTCLHIDMIQKWRLGGYRVQD